MPTHIQTTVGALIAILLGAVEDSVLSCSLTHTFLYYQPECPDQAVKIYLVVVLNLHVVSWIYGKLFPLFSYFFHGMLE